MKKQRKRKILLGLLAIPLVIGITVGGFFAWMEINYRRADTAAVALPAYETGEGSDAVHFLPTGSGDAILLESQGRFALIDAAEDNDNPTNSPDLELKGYEQLVRNYVKQTAGGPDGRTHLDFVIGTHAHSDHIGGFDTLFQDESVTVDTVYLKKYIPEGKNKVEQSWDNQEVHDQMVDAARARDFMLVQEMPTESFVLGNFTVTICNGEDRRSWWGDENDNSLGILIEKGSRRIFLSGDINNWSGDEIRLAREIGKVDLLKAGHHSYFGSNSVPFVRGLDPDIVVVTNDYVDSFALRKFIAISHSTVYTTGQSGGVLATVEDDGIRLCALGVSEELNTE